MPDTALKQHQYQAKLNLAIQEVWDEWRHELSYTALAKGLLVVMSNHMLTFLRRLNDD